MSKLTVTLPDDLHQQIRLELERQGITTAQFIELAVHNFLSSRKKASTWQHEPWHFRYPRNCSSASRNISPASSRSITAS